MKAALVTLQKKIKGYDAQIAGLVREKDSLHSKVSQTTAVTEEFLVHNNSNLQSGMYRSGQLKAGQAHAKHSCTKKRTSWQAVKHSSRSRLCACGKPPARVCKISWLGCSQVFLQKIQQLETLQTTCSRLQQDSHQQSAACSNARQELDRKEGQLKGLRQQQQSLSNSKACSPQPSLHLT